MAIYTIADLHLSLGVNKPMDVFGGWENYQTKLAESFFSTLKQEDTLVLPGDLSWGISLEQSLKDFQFIEKIPGRKIISKGNHDYYWTTRRKMEAFFTEHNMTSIDILHNNAFVAEGYAICGTRGWVNDGAETADQKVILREAGRLRTSILAAKKMGLPILCFLHYPPIFGGKKCKEIWAVLKEEKIEHCFYGHLHGKAIHHATQGKVEGITLKLISADYLSFKPYKIT